MFEYWRDGRTGYIVASTNVCVAIFFSFQHVLLYVHGHMEMEMERVFLISAALVLILLLFCSFSESNILLTLPYLNVTVLTSFSFNQPFSFLSSVSRYMKQGDLMPWKTKM